MALRARKVSGAFEKRAPGLWLQSATEKKNYKNAEQSYPPTQYLVKVWLFPVAPWKECPASVYVIVHS